jgi:predicted transcriptional regulator YdeE
MSEKSVQHAKLKTLDELKLVGFRVVCVGEAYINEIPKAFKKLNERTFSIKHVIDPTIQWGAFVVDEKTEDEDGYWVGVQVKDYEDIPQDMLTLTIPPQKYATCRHQGSNQYIKDTYTELHRWIDKEDFKRLVDTWHLEKFYSWDDIESIDVEIYDTIQ